MLAEARACQSWGVFLRHSVDWRMVVVEGGNVLHHEKRTGIIYIFIRQKGSNNKWKKHQTHNNKKTNKTEKKLRSNRNCPGREFPGNISEWKCPDPTDTVQLRGHGSVSVVKQKQGENIGNRVFPCGCYVEGGMKNCDFQQLYRFISETIQDMSRLQY